MSASGERERERERENKLQFVEIQRRTKYFAEQRTSDEGKESRENGFNDEGPPPKKNGHLAFWSHI